MKRKHLIYLVLTLCMVIVLVLGFTHIKFIKKGYFVTFHKSGTIGSVDTNEKQDGMFDIYLNGKIVRRENFKSGSLDGWKIDYYDNGNIRIKESFKVGRSDGPKIMYYKNGQIEQKSYRKNDKVEGMEYVYYEDGSLKYKRNWINNNPYGDFYYYYQNKKTELYHAYDILGNRFYLCRYDTMAGFQNVLETYLALLFIPKIKMQSKCLRLVTHINL